MTPRPSADPYPTRPDNREIEHENLRPPAEEGAPPRPATEPEGAGWSQRGDKTETDPGSGQPREESKGRETRQP